MPTVPEHWFWGLFMGLRAVVVSGILVLGMFGCATQHAASAPGKAQRGEVHGASAPVEQASFTKPAERRYVDPQLGFEIIRPMGNWQLDANDEITPEGLAIPVVLRQRETGAQVVIQVAPAVASPAQFAERLTAGLRSHPGFTSTDPEPIPLAEGAVGFAFALGNKVSGKVAVVEGKSGQVFMMMATWPADAPTAVAMGVDEVFNSLRPIPRT